MATVVNDRALAGAGQPIKSIYADEADFQDLLKYFVEVLPERQLELQAGLEEGDIYLLKSVAHQLKGAGGGYGFPGLTERAQHLEMMCKMENHAEIPESLQALVSYMEQICR